jgi:PmbA protein
VTGDFSVGAVGLWIENGEIAFPVEEVTTACSIDQIPKGIERAGSDLLFHSSVVSPTFQAAEMTISGRRPARVQRERPGAYDSF